MEELVPLLLLLLLLSCEEDDFLDDAPGELEAADFLVDGFAAGCLFRGERGGSLGEGIFFPR